MLRVKVDQNDPTNLHEQVAANIRRAIADGEPGRAKRLPPAKDLAAVIGVTTKHVLARPSHPPRQGLLEFRVAVGHRYCDPTPKHRGHRARRSCAPASTATPEPKLLELIDSLG